MQFVRFKLATRQAGRQGQQASKAKQAVIFPYYLNGAIRLIMRVLYKKPRNGIINGTVHLLLSGANYIFVYFPSGFFSVCALSCFIYLCFLLIFSGGVAASWQLDSLALGQVRLVVIVFFKFPFVRILCGFWLFAFAP